MINDFLEEYFELIEKYNMAFDVSENCTLELRRITDAQIDRYIDSRSIDFYMDVYPDEIDD